MSGTFARTSLRTFQASRPPRSTALLDERRREVSINVIKKLCDGLEITLGDFFNVSLFNDLEQEIK